MARRIPYARELRQIYLEATPFLLVTILAEVVAGILLHGLEGSLKRLPGLLVLIPGLMSLRGSVSTTLGQRLGSLYHLGLVRWEDSLRNPIVWVNIFANILLTLIAVVPQVIVAYILLSFLKLPSMSLGGLLFIGLSVAFISGLMLSLLTVFIALYSAHKGLDPDNITVPLIATIGDIITVVSVFLSISLYYLVQILFHIF